MQHFVRYDAE